MARALRKCTALPGAKQSLCNMLIQDFALFG